MPQWPDSPAEAMHLQQFCMEVLPLIPCKSNKNYHDLFEAAIPWLNNAFQVAGLSRRVAGRRDIELLRDYFKRLFQIVSSKRRKTGSVTRAFEKLEAGYADLPEHLRPLGVSDGVREMGERLARKALSCNPERYPQSTSLSEASGRSCMRWPQETDLELKSGSDIVAHALYGEVNSWTGVASNPVHDRNQSPYQESYATMCSTITPWAGPDLSSFFKLGDALHEPLQHSNTSESQILATNTQEATAGLHTSGCDRTLASKKMKEVSPSTSSLTFYPATSKQTLGKRKAPESRDALEERYAKLARVFPTYPSAPLPSRLHSISIAPADLRLQCRASVSESFQIADTTDLKGKKGETTLDQDLESGPSVPISRSLTDKKLSTIRLRNASLLKNVNPVEDPFDFADPIPGDAAALSSVAAPEP